MADALAVASPTLRAPFLPVLRAHDCGRSCPNLHEFFTSQDETRAVCCRRRAVRWGVVIVGIVWLIRGAASGALLRERTVSKETPAEILVT